MSWICTNIWSKMGWGEILSIAITFCSTKNSKEKACTVGNQHQMQPELAAAKERRKKLKHVAPGDCHGNNREWWLQEQDITRSWWHCMNYSTKIGPFYMELGRGIFPTSQESRMLVFSKKSQARTLQMKLPNLRCEQNCHSKTAHTLVLFQGSPVSHHNQSMTPQ